MRIVKKIPSIAQGEYAHVYALQLFEKVLVASCFLDGNAVTVSFFARALSGSERLRVLIQSPYSSQTKDFQITNDWCRFDLSMWSDISLEKLEVFFTSNLVGRALSEIAIAFFQIEEDLFATSPIPPDIPLPSIVPKGVQGETRKASRLILDTKQLGLVVSSSSATMIMVCTPTPTTNQISAKKFLTFMSFFSPDSSMELSIGISGAHGNKFVLRKISGGEKEFILSDVVASNQKYFICAVFDRNNVTVIVNGVISLVDTLSEEVMFEKIGVGNAVDKEHPDNFSGFVERFAQYEAPLLYPRILQIYQFCCPENNHYTYDYMLRYFRYCVVEDNEKWTLDTCMADEGFSYFVKQLEFSIPKIYEQFPPSKHFVEEDVRDYVRALMQRPGEPAGREEYSKLGRTDLTLKYIPAYYVEFVDEKQGPSQGIYRTEFKIWGRNGYKDAPAQPLKYMGEAEHVAAFVMIDRRKNSSISDFQEIVNQNPEYPCVGIREIPLLENTDLRYFVSFHQDKRYRTLRMIVNFYLPILE